MQTKQQKPSRPSINCNCKYYLRCICETDGSVHLVRLLISYSDTFPGNYINMLLVLCQIFFEWNCCTDVLCVHFQWRKRYVSTLRINHQGGGPGERWAWEQDSDTRDQGWPPETHGWSGSANTGWWETLWFRLNVKVNMPSPADCGLFKYAKSQCFPNQEGNTANGVFFYYLCAENWNIK